MNIIHSLDLIKAIERCRLSGNLHIAISHSPYLKYDGGIEHCLRREVTLATQMGVDYLHIHPSRFYIDSQLDFAIVEVTLNNEVIGLTSLDGLSAKLKYINPQLTLLHSPIGYSPDSLLRLLLTLKHISTILQWIHDLSFACDSITLIRNGMFCGLPKLNAATCIGCKYNESRSELHLLYDQLERISDYQLFPTNATKKRYNFIRNTTTEQLKKQIVVPHYITKCYTTELLEPKIDSIDKEIGIAFFGHSIEHKGWREYLSLVTAIQDVDCFRFFHVGTAGATDPRIQLIHFSEITSPNSLSQICKTNNIKLAFFWSLTLEAFGIMFRQVLETECAVICRADDDALREFIFNCDKIFYFNTISEVISAVRNKLFIENLLLKARTSRCTLQSSNLSYTLGVRDSLHSTFKQ